jgi:hypothetical protein
MGWPVIIAILALATAAPAAAGDVPPWHPARSDCLTAAEHAGIGDVADELAFTEALDIAAQRGCVPLARAIVEEGIHRLGLGTLMIAMHDLAEPQPDGATVSLPADRFALAERMVERALEAGYNREEPGSDWLADTGAAALLKMACLADEPLLPIQVETAFEGFARAFPFDPGPNPLFHGATTVEASAVTLLMDFGVDCSATVMAAQRGLSRVSDE